ncbi:MAG: hypothetical protein H0W73_13545 [Bacteroidetes bacterium]|nr:hypothetical protein [Bacteroidota bacterium]
MPNTGEVCQQSGMYQCSVHPNQKIPLSNGEKFPPCNTVGGNSHGTTWILLQKL